VEFFGEPSKIGDQTVLQWADVNSSVHLAISFGIDGRMIRLRLMRWGSRIRSCAMTNRFGFDLYPKEVR
jgi:hypothetical protein